MAYKNLKQTINNTYYDCTKTTNSHIFLLPFYVSKTYGTFKKQSANVRNVCGDPISLIDFVDTDKAFDKLSIVFDAALSSFEFYLKYHFNGNAL